MAAVLKQVLLSDGLTLNECWLCRMAAAVDSTDIAQGTNRQRSRTLQVNSSQHGTVALAALQQCVQLQLRRWVES